MEKLHCLPNELDDVPAHELAEIAAFYQWQEEERAREAEAEAVAKGREFTRDMLGEDDPATIGG